MTVRLRSLGAVALACLLLAGCGSGDPTPAPTPTKTFSYARSAPDPAKRCPKFPATATKVVIPSTEGLEIAGAEAGSGPRGLVLLHQRDADLCGWAEYIGDFVKSGLHVLAIDLRCSGLSDCPPDVTGDAFFAPLDRAADAGAAVNYLRQHGATTVAVMGASMGAATAVVTAGRFPDQVDAVVALSLPSAVWNASGLTETAVRTPADAVPKIKGPILLAGAGLDPDAIPADVAPQFLEGAPARSRCVIVSRPESGSHGWDLLGTAPDTVEPQVLDFLAANLKA